MKAFLLIFTFFFAQSTIAQDVNVLVNRVKAKLDQVNDYEATGKMKTNVAFLKIPVADVTLYFKKPGKLKLKSQKGVSFMPKGAVSMDMGSLFAGNEFTVIDAGKEKLGNVMVSVVKLLPKDDEGDVVLSTLYINPLNALIYKSKTTTRENGTYQLELSYGKYISFGLPDKILFTFNTKDYKLPKGMTFDFDDGEAAAGKQMRQQPKQGKAEITFNSYLINKGVSDSRFK